MPSEKKIRLKTNFLKANTNFIDLEVMSEQLGLQPDTSSVFLQNAVSRPPTSLPRMKNQ